MHVTGIQAATVGIVRQLDGWQDQFSREEYQTLLAVLKARVERDLDDEPA